MRTDFTNMTLEELATYAQDQGLANVHLAVQEFTRRQTIAQQEASAAQVRAAKAAEDTATYTKQNAKYLLWSVIILTLSSVLTFVLSVLTFLGYARHVIQ